MNSRERVLTAINHVQPDRTPVDLYAVEEVWNKLRKHYKSNDDDRILETLDVDCRWLWPEYLGPAPKVYADGSYDGWGGSILRKVKNQYGYYEEVSKYVLDGAESPDDIDRLLVMPNPDDFDFKSVAEACKRYKDYFIFAGWANLLHTPVQVRKMEDILVDMAINPEMAHYLIKKSLEWHLAYHERLLDAGKGRIDSLVLVDDYSTQQGPLFSMEMFKTFYKEPIRKYVELGKSYNAKIYFHCCGSVYPFISELIDLGVEILDPIQTTAVNMDPMNLKKDFGDKITFHGAVNTQSILPTGTPEEVRKNTKEMVNILGKDGGYIMTSCHYLQADVPIENILAMFEIGNR